MGRCGRSELLWIVLSACDGGGRTLETDADVPCTVVVRYDWDDGSTQGWSASTTVSNPGTRLVVLNQGNGSLQAFGPEAGYSLADTDEISFMVQIDEYSAVTAPSELVNSSFAYNTPMPGDGSLRFALDMSMLTFGQPRTFTLPVSAGAFTGALTRSAFLAHAKFPSLMFTDNGFAANTSAATLDNFVVGCAR